MPHPRDQGETAGLVVGVEAFDVLRGHLRGGAGADLQADRVGEQLREGDVCAVELPGAVADPQEVRRQVVQAGLVPCGVETQHRTLVVEHEGFMTCVDCRGTQVRIDDPAGVHEPQAAVDLGGECLVASTGRRRCDELAIPVVDPVQVGFTTGGDGTHQVHRGAGVGVCPDQA